MRSVPFIFAFLLIQAIALSQPCLPDGITFTTQAQVDSFHINYPNCTEIEGYVVIGGENISNLSGLNMLTSIGGVLLILGNDSLTTLSGLDSLTIIGEGLRIGLTDWGGANLSLTSIASLSNLTSIGGSLNISNNPQLISILGLEGLSSVKDLRIDNNNSLVDLQGLQNITYITGTLDIESNSSLTSLSALEELVAIGGSLIILGNDLTNSLNGLHNIDAESISDLWIGYNNTLSTCEVQSICDYLVSPNGFFNIDNNATGCNSPEEVEYACESASIVDLSIIKDCTVSPNPFTISTILSYTLDKPSSVIINIFNPQGQLIEKIEQKQPKGEQQVQWNAEGLPAGMYYYRIQAGDKVGSGKMVKLQ